MHLNTANCESCEEKLAQVHPTLARWARILRNTHPDAHISCGYRGQADQEEAFNSGHSRAHYGQSAHNLLPSQAIDLFRIGPHGEAIFDATWFRDVIAPIVRASGLVWGGDWKHIIDMPHVEMPGFKPFAGS